MDWFKGQFERSNIISGFLAVAIWAAIIYLAVVSREVPEILYYGGATVIAFFFGSKVGQTEGRAIERAQSMEHRGG